MAEIAPKTIEREGLRTLVRRGGQLVEVLPREEYDRLHIAGAVSIPLSSFSRNTADRLKWDSPVIVYAQDCLDDRSARAAWRLSSLGFTQVFRYIGGKAEWMANGLPVEGTAIHDKTAGDYADMDVPTCKRNEPVRSVRQRVEKESSTACVVVNDELVVLGLLAGTDLTNADQSWPAEDAMDRDPLTVRLDASVKAVLKVFQTRPSQFALVTTSDGKLFGLLKREDIEVAAYSKDIAGD